MLIKECRSCKSTKLNLVLDLGVQPLSNGFLKPENISAEEKKFPLAVAYCASCSLFQLNYTVDPSLMFGDYVYVTSNTKPLAEHLQKMARNLYQLVNPHKGDVVIDVGCNDGSLLSGYPKDGVVRLGVEPSSVADIASNRGIKVYNDFFNSITAKKIVSNDGPASIVTATNVFAHVADQYEFLNGLNTVLHNEGIFVIEVPHVQDMLEKNLFDTIYHEHIFYFSLISLENLLRLHGFRVFNVEKYDFGPSGPPIRVFICKDGAKHKRSPSVDKLKEEEISYGISTIKVYMNFAKRVWQVKTKLLNILEDLKGCGENILGFGAPAKGNTILNTFNINKKWIDYILEKNQFKCGLLTPGTHIPVVNEDEFDYSSYRYGLLLSWNLADYLIKSSNFIKRGGKFIVPLPQPAFIP